MGKGKASKISKSQEIIKDLDSSDTFDNSEEDEELNFKRGETQTSDDIKYFFVDDLANKLPFTDPTKPLMSCIGFFDNNYMYKDDIHTREDKETGDIIEFYVYKFYIYCIGGEDGNEYKQLCKYKFDFPKKSSIAISVFLEKEKDKKLIKAINEQDRFTDGEDRFTDGEETKEFYEFKCKISKNKNKDYGKYKLNIYVNKYNTVSGLSIKDNKTEYNNKLLKAFNSTPNLSKKEVEEAFREQGDMQTLEEMRKMIE